MVCCYRWIAVPFADLPLPLRQSPCSQPSRHLEIAKALMAGGRCRR